MKVTTHIGFNAAVPLVTDNSPAHLYQPEQADSIPNFSSYKWVGTFSPSENIPKHAPRGSLHYLLWTYEYMLISMPKFFFFFFLIYCNF